MTKERATRIRWLMIGWLFVLSAVAFLDRVNLSVAGASLARIYRLGNVQFGFLSTAFLIGYALFQAPAGWLADRFGPRRVLTLGLIGWGIFTALTASLPAAVASPIIALVLIRFLLGMGEAVMYPAANQFTARWIPTGERGAANGWIFAGVGIGSGLSPALITYVMLHHGWRSSFFLCAAIGVLAGLIWYLLARDTPANHPWVSSQELNLIRSGLTLQSLPPGSPAREAPAVPWRAVLRDKNILLITASYFGYGYVTWIFFAWFFRYLAEVRGLNLKASAFYATLPFLAMAIGCPLGGIASDWLTHRFGRRAGRCGLAAVAIALAATFLALGSIVSSARLASLVLAGGAGTLYLSQSSYWSISADISGRFSGSVSGFMNMGGQFGGAVTASLTPFIAAHFGWTASFLVAAALCMTGALLWLLVDPNRGLAIDAPSERNLVAAEP